MRHWHAGFRAVMAELVTAMANRAVTSVAGLSGEGGRWNRRDLHWRCPPSPRKNP